LGKTSRKTDDKIAESVIDSDSDIAADEIAEYSEHSSTSNSSEKHTAVPP
jgi:hypothetical protein